MSKVSTAPKTRKSKTNNFVLILERFLEKYKLSADSTPEQLSEHAPELGASLPDWKARKCVKDALARRTENRRAFSKEQIGALVPDERKKKLTIKERAEYCAKTGDKWDIYLQTLELCPKSNDDNEIVASCSRLSLFRNELEKVGIAPELIDTYAKYPDVITASNKIQQKRTKHNLANDRSSIPKGFSLEKVLERIQNIDTTKDPSLQDLADVMVMLSMRPAEVSSLQIIHYYEPDFSDLPAWYEKCYSWYCTDYKKNKGEKKNNPEPRPFLSMEKDPERARALLIWIQEVIKAGKLRDPTFSENGKRNTRAFSKFLKSHEITPKILRKIGGKYACRVHGGPNATHQELDRLNRIALRHKIRLDAGKNYAIRDTDSEDSGPESEHEPSPMPQSPGLASSPQPKNSDYIPFESQIAEIDSMLAGF